MRYFTKEWYNDTLLADMCFQIKSSAGAEKFSEKRFESLYKAQKKWFVKNEKRVAKFNKTPFDQNASESAFEASFNENLEFVKKNLPEEILEKVADVRMLAMGSASYDITHAIVRFCGQVNRRCEAVQEEYDAEVEKLAERIGWYKINLLNMISNAPVASIEESDDTLTLRTSPDYTEVACEVRFTAPQVSVCDENLVGARILHFEILPLEGEKVEFNMLCSTDEGKSRLFSATASDFDIIEL